MGTEEPSLGVPSTLTSCARDWRRAHVRRGRSCLARSSVMATTNYGRHMRFSVWPAPGRPVDEILDLARLTDDLGWFSFWFADHYMGNTGTTELVAGDTHEAWSILPAVAAVTSKIRLGPLVAPTSIHHPALLANRAATIDHLSGGRMVLGLGAGWQINEHHAYGIELEAPGARVSRFEESIQIVRSLLDNERTDFDGDFYTFTDAPCDPKPIQEKLPLLVGTGVSYHRSPRPRMEHVGCTRDGSRAPHDLHGRLRGSRR